MRPKRSTKVRYLRESSAASSSVRAAARCSSSSRRRTSIGWRSASGSAAAHSSSCSSWTSRSRTAPSTPPSQPSSSRSLVELAGRASAKSERPARSRRVATRMSCSSSMSSPRRVPGSWASMAEKCRRSTVRATVPMGALGSIAVGPNVSGAGAPRPADSRPASYFDSAAGWSPQATRRPSTNGVSAGVDPFATSISTRRRRAGGPPAGSLIDVSSSAMCPAEPRV